ncbi:GDSL-type esterase/lipase family protein [uncultured Ruegeria sp.]|uniref:SGNH/GDSL hydrolase family protein n=1 Tax=uncultured Ruegeria sp. TaxID=259304 RepID=UPI00260B509C|nr:GDSL-type esterase/lipase family protein [uncultured Ruegeria sp.]
MKKRTGNRILLVANLVLTLLLAAVLVKTGYLSKTVRKFTGAHVPVTETDHYKLMVWLHERPISQALASSDIKIAFIGDSIIEGWLTSNILPYSLNLGISRDTTPGLIARAKPELIAHVPTWYLGIGVNDALAATPPEEIAGYVAQLNTVFMPAERLIWRAVLPVTGASWTAEMEAFRTAFNKAALQACQEMVNCTFLTPPDGYEENIVSWTSDGLHPNSIGYRQLAQQLCTEVSCSP